MASTGWDWVFHALGWALAAAGLLLTLWALFWDRSRGRKRCPKCWYSMEGAAQGEGGEYVCPECGKVIADDRTLHRTRRRPRWVVISLMVWIVGYAVFVTPAVRRDGWIAVTPTSALIVIASPDWMKPIAPESLYDQGLSYDFAIENELRIRGEERSIYNWQADLLAWRIRRASINQIEEIEFRSYDITTMLSPAWWSSPIVFTDEDKARLYGTIHDLITTHAIVDLWIDNGGDEASLFRMGNRIYVSAPRLKHHSFEQFLNLLITKGQGDLDRVKVSGWYGGEEKSHEVRIYNVTDIAPPSVERYVESPPPEPHGAYDTYFIEGELIFNNREIFDLVDGITSNVRMEDWIDNGGELATIRGLQGWLIIWASPEMHDLVAQRIELHRAGKIGKEDGPP